MAFLYVLTDLAGVPLSELPGASARRFALAVGSMATAGAQVRSDHEDADTLLECDTLLKVYETGVPGTGAPVLHFHGRQVTGEEVLGEGGGTVAATFADPYWILLRRLIGKSAAGYTRGTSTAPVDRGTIITELVAATNAEAVSRVRMGTVTASSTTYVAGWFYKKIGEAIAELGATLDGPDWRVRPIEYTGGVIGELDVAPVIGQQRPDAAFDLGGGLLNVRSARRAVTLEGAANRMHSLPPGFPDNATQAVITRDNAGSLAVREMLEEALATDLNVDELRSRLLDHHLAVRGGPRQTITFDPVRDLASDAGRPGRVPRLGVDFNVGDVVPFAAWVRRMVGGTLTPVPRLDIMVRVYGVEVNADDNSMTLTVTPSG